MCKLVFNLNDGTLGKYKVGSDVPDELNNEHFHNYDDGYSVAVFNNQISAILICFRCGYRDFNEFKGIVFFNDKEFEFDVNTTIDEMISVLGDPDDQWNDGIEQGLDYSINNINIEIIWNVAEETTLDYISIEPS